MIAPTDLLALLRNRVERKKKRAVKLACDIRTGYVARTDEVVLIDSRGNVVGSCEYGQPLKIS